MLNAQELRNKIACLLTKARQENAALQQSCTGLVAHTSKAHLITVYLENMQEIRRQLQELVGDDVAVAMIAEELGTHMKPPKLPTG